MGWMEIALIILGVIVLIVSCVIPAGKKGENNVSAPKIDEKMIKDMVAKEIEGAKSHINDMVDETLNYSMEKTERAMERLTNEKIMAINEYSEQVLTAINKNHQEVMFLYDMLNDKHENLVNTVSEASKKAKEIKQTVQDAEITVREAAEMIAEDAGTIAGNIENFENTEGRIKSLKEEGKRAESSDSASETVEETILQNREDADNTEETEFIPIAPKRVELIQGAVGEEAIPDTNAGAESLSESETEDEKNHNDKILRLHKLGKSKTAIAKELGLGVGEVKLVIDLFEQ